MRLFFPNYKLFKYERELALSELDSFYPNTKKLVNDEYVDIELRNVSAKDISLAKRLTYFSKIQVNNKLLNTTQNEMELSCPKSGRIKRQSTRYGAHGIHEYKGKFNPQIVSSILNLEGLEPGANILEPFCGSGTTLYESSIKGFNAVGFDFNPLAVFISNTKLQSIGLDFDECESKLFEMVGIAKQSLRALESTSDRDSYLNSWFEEEQLIKIEALRFTTLKFECNDIYKNLLLCCASNILREYSQQEPADLRIRRRISPMPEVCFFEKLIEEVKSLLTSLRSFSLVANEVKKDSVAHCIDIRTDEVRKHTNFDAAITSPPYATALPYIDTQRLSLVWLGMALPKEVKRLENTLIGSRELSKREQNALQSKLIGNSYDIPIELHSLCIEMMDSLTSDDGFRRQAMPHVVYRYFYDMKLMFINVSKMLKKNGSFNLVVGHNKTTLGGRVFDLDTPSYLLKIAESIGWEIQNNRFLETYKRYDLHKSNSINIESLITVKNV